MKNRVVALLGAMVCTTTIAGFASPVHGQSSVTPGSNGEYTIKGASLNGIDNRSAEDDFNKFFPVNTVNRSSTTIEDNNVTSVSTQISDRVQLRRMDQPITLTDTPAILQPYTNVNDGAVQVQLDFGE
jgi:hypothetical protein